MSWEPAWVPDGRGGFRRNRAAAEEGDDSGKKSETKEKKGKERTGPEDDDTEEEGEITPIAPSSSPRNNSSHLDPRGPYRPRGPNATRFHPRDRPRSRGSFSGMPPNPRVGGANNNSSGGNGNNSFGREGSFSSGSNNSTPYPPRDGPPPPPPFRGGEPPPFRDQHNNRDLGEGPGIRGGRDYRDYGPSSSSGGPRGESNGHTKRDGRNDVLPPQKRDYVDGPQSRDFRAEQQQGPSRDFRNDTSREFRGSNDFRGEPLLRDYRGQTDPSVKSHRGDPPARDFRGAGDSSKRDFRGDGLPRDFRDRNDGLPHINRDFRSGAQPNIGRDAYGRESYQKSSISRGAGGGAVKDGRDFNNAQMQHRDGPSFMPTGNDGMREPGGYRDSHQREPSFRDGHPRDGRESNFRDVPSRDHSYRDTPRDVGFRDVPRDPQFQGNSRDRDTPFTKRDSAREPQFGNRDYTHRGELTSSIREPLERSTQSDLANSFGGGRVESSSRESPFVSGNIRTVGGHAMGARNPPVAREPGQSNLHGPYADGSRDNALGEAGTSNGRDDLKKPPNKLPIQRSGSQTVPSASGPAAATSGYGAKIPSTAGAQAGLGSNLVQKGRPTDPRRRPSKELNPPPPPPPASSASSGQTPSRSSSSEGAAVASGGADARPAAALPGINTPFVDGPPNPASLASSRRMSSYSSLADAPTATSSAVPTQTPSQPEIPPTQGPVNRLPTNFRSPLPRRSLSDGSTRERGDYYGPSENGPQQRHWSPSSDRGRPLLASSIPSPHRPAQPHGSAQHAPSPAPSLTPRPTGGRNDPRFKHQDKGKKEITMNRQESDAAVPGHAALKGEARSRFGENCTENSNHPKHGGSMSSTQSGGKGAASGSLDLFGRTRDWKERQQGHRMSGTSSTGSPSKQKPILSGTSAGVAQLKAPAPLVQTNRIKRQKSASSDKPTANTNSASGEADNKQNPPVSNLPLLTSSLGDESSIKRAEAAIAHLGIMLSQRNAQTACSDLSKLPTKQVIMSAVSEIEKEIKEAVTESEKSEEQRQAAVQQEESDSQLAKERLEVEKREWIARKEKRAADRVAEEEKSRSEGLKNALEDNKSIVKQAMDKLEKELEEEIAHAKDEETKRFNGDMQAQIATAAEKFDNDVAEIRHELEKAKSAAAKVDAKYAAAESELNVFLQNEATSRGRHKSPFESTARVSDVIKSVTTSNQRKSAEAQAMSLSLLCDDDGDGVGVGGSEQGLNDSTRSFFQNTVDPRHKKSLEEWGIMTKQIASTEDALYTEPSEAPYFDHVTKTHELIGLSVKEYVRSRRNQLMKHWMQLAEEYEIRKRLYEKQQRKLSKKAQRGSISVAGRKSIMGKESTGRSGLERPGSGFEASARSSNNPYRRARRGNEVRSEYEQEQIIAEIAAKEAMERRITHGGSKLPRQLCRHERDVSASYINTFSSQVVEDPMREAKTEASRSVWTDMEKCIFLDRFLQFPKDFRKIASFLRNKTTKDCVAFYYNSKQTVPYKGALKEHIMRRKRKGDYQVWDATIQAAISVGATVTAGSGEDKPVVFSLPTTDRTYKTRWLHPLKRRVLDLMPIPSSADMDVDSETRSEEAKWKSRKRGRDPIFSLDEEQTKFLRLATQESLMTARPKPAVEEPKCAPPAHTKALEAEPLTSATTASGSGTSTPARKTPQKWTASEKKIFLATLGEHGRDWTMLSKAVGTKSISQIKNFYYDYKKQSGKHRISSDKKSSRTEAPAKVKDAALSTTKSSSKEWDEGSGKDMPSSRQKAETPGVPGRNPYAHEVATTAVSTTVVPNRNEPSLSVLGATPSKTVNRTMVGSGANSQRPQETRNAGSAGILESVESKGGIPDFVSGGTEAIQQLLTRQMQQPQQARSHQSTQQPRQPQASLQQLLNQQQQQQHRHQHRVREQPTGPVSLDETRHLLQHPSHSRHQQVLSNLLPWLTTSQLTTSQILQAQSRLQQAQAAAAMQEGNSMGPVAEVPDVSSLQRLLQMQQSGSNRYAVSQSSRNAVNPLLVPPGGLPASLLSNMDQLGASNGAGGDPTGDGMQGLGGAQGLLSFGGAGQRTASGSGGGISGVPSMAGNALFGTRPGSGGTMDTSTMSDALSLLARAIPRGEAPNHNFGLPPDRTDGGDRFG